jgi:hypothetical protein
MIKVAEEETGELEIGQRRNVVDVDVGVGA